MSVEMADVSGLSLEQHGQTDDERMREKAREAQEQVRLLLRSHTHHANI